MSHMARVYCVPWILDFLLYFMCKIKYSLILDKLNLAKFYLSQIYFSKVIALILFYFYVCIFCILFYLIKFHFVSSLLLYSHKFKVITNFKCFRCMAIAIAFSRWICIELFEFYWINLIKMIWMRIIKHFERKKNHRYAKVRMKKIDLHDPKQQIG